VARYRSLCYGCGLRAGEVVRLKVKHIDSAQKIIRIEQSKGRKDRNVTLSRETIDLLRQWWKARRGFDAHTPIQDWTQTRHADGPEISWSMRVLRGASLARSPHLSASVPRG